MGLLLKNNIRFDKNLIYVVKLLETVMIKNKCYLILY